LIAQDETPRASESAVRQWERGQTQAIRPTLIVLRSRERRDMEAFRQDVEQRLASLVELGAVRWLEWINMDSAPEPEYTGEEIIQACKPLFALDLWQRLVEKGYQSDLPSPRSPAQVQIIVVWDVATECDYARTAALLRRISQQLKEQIQGQANILPILILVGQTLDLQPQDVDVYRLRIRLGTIALGGEEVGRPRMLEVCRHLLVSLISSELVRALTFVVKGQEDEVAWFILGASALLVDLPTIRHWLEELVLKYVLEPWVAVPFDDINRQLTSEAVAEQARTYFKRMFKEALDGLRESGWKVLAFPDGSGVQHSRLTNPILRREAFGPYQGWLGSSETVSRQNRQIGKGLSRLRDAIRAMWETLLALSKPFLPGSDLDDRLREHYTQLCDNLDRWLSKDGWRGLTPRLREEYEILEAFLGSFLDRGVRSFYSEKGTYLPLNQRDLPVGLRAAAYAVARMGDELGRGSDIRLTPTLQPSQEAVCPASMEDVRFLQTAAETDAQVIRGYMRRYARFARSLASPLGVVLNLIPAWPLAALLLDHLPGWDSFRSTVVAGVGLLILGIADLVYWWLVRARGLLHEVRQRAHQVLADRVLTWAARSLRDHRLWIVIRLREVGSALMDLYTTFGERYDRAERVWRGMEKTSSYARNGSYHLVDIHEIQERARLVAEEVNLPVQNQGFESAVTALVAEQVWPLAEQPTSARAVLWELEERCHRQVNKRWQPERFTPAVIVEKMEALKAGQRWLWLWKQAQPLGQLRSEEHSSFTVMLTSKSALLGGSGKSSPYWQEEWLDAVTFQEHEEICIRGVILWKRGEG